MVKYTFTPSPDGTFDTGVLMSGDAFEWTPTVSGEYLLLYDMLGRLELLL